MIDCHTSVKHYVLTVIGWSCAGKMPKNASVKRVKHFCHPEKRRKVFDTFDRGQNGPKTLRTYAENAVNTFCLTDV